MDAGKPPNGFLAHQLNMEMPAYLNTVVAALHCWPWLNKEAHLQVRAEALLDKFHRKGGDGSSEVEGYEGSWRRATVVEHLKKEKSDKRRWVVIQLVDPKVCHLSKSTRKPCMSQHSFSRPPHNL